MDFISPISALVAAAVTVPLLVALYFLKLRRQEMAVPTTLLWKRAVQDLQVNAPFQKLRRNLLLLLQLLILAALLVAMARPTMQAAARPGQRVAILIDHSASMNATDGDAASGETRLDAAKRAALELIDHLAMSQTGAGEGGAMVVSFADRAQVVQTFTGDLARLRQAVRAIEPTDQLSHLAPALRLIEPYAIEAQATGSDKLVVYVISDGRVHMPTTEQLALKGAELVPVGVGGGGASGGDSGGADNLAIVAFSARRDFERPEVVQVYARLMNYGPAAVRTNVELRVDDTLLRVTPVVVPGAKEDPTDSRRSSVGMGEEQRLPHRGAGVESVQFDFVLPGSALVEVRHGHADLLAADDAARLTLAPARRLRVLLVSEGNAFLERVIRSVGVQQLVVMHPKKYEDQDPQRLRRSAWDENDPNLRAGFDVIVFDTYAPAAVPVVDSLYFGAAPPIEGLAIRPTPEDSAEPKAQVVLDWARDEALLRYVVLDDVVLRAPGRLVVPAEAKVLATAQAGPVMAEVRSAGVRHVVASFDVLQTNWPLYVSFPVFMSNVVETLGLGGLADEAGLALRTGEVAVVPVAEEAGGLPGAEVAYTGPVAVTGRVRGGQAVVPTASGAVRGAGAGGFARVGVYRTESPGVAPPFDRLAVNLLDELESDLRPVGELRVGTEAVAVQARSLAIQREVWPWLAWAALAVLLVEWWVYTRRMHL